MTKTNTTRTARRVACPKCSGTGIVDRFLDYEGGVCFDCNGTGALAVSLRPTSRKVDPRKVARAVGDAVIAGQDVDEADAVAAFEWFEDAHPTTWSQADYDRRNTLGRKIGRVI